MTLPGIDHTQQPGQRIIVVGTSGSGKTTLAHHLATRWNVPHVELDALHWESDWQEAPVPVFRERVTRALSSDAWCADGNYRAVRDIVWGRADTLIWLDYPLWICLVRLLRRTLHRMLTRDPLWGTNNRENLRTALFQRDSLFLWAIQTHSRRRRDYFRLLSQPENAHITVIRLHSSRDTDRWLASLPGPKRTESR